MACRIPIVATNTAQGAGELLRKHPLGTLVPKANAEELAQAIRDRFEKPASWLARIEPARDYVESHHSLLNWVDNMSQVLTRIANKP
jgi:glycosyltransferase involved in cell wall biosynthesis